MPILAPKLKLNDGNQIPAIGMGSFQLNPGHPEEMVQAVKDAVDIGYRHFDSAFFYKCEKEIGEGIKAKIDDGVIKRENVFITSKLWCYHNRKKMVVPMCKKAVETFDLGPLDLFLIHWPMGFAEGTGREAFGTDSVYSDMDYVDTWKGMEDCVQLGLTKSIGVSNFNSQQLQRVLDSCKIKPTVNQVECHPFLSQNKLLDFCRKRDILLIAYSPIGGQLDRSNRRELLEEPVLKQIGGKYDKTPAQVTLRWHIQRKVLPIPKSTKKHRLEQNFNVFDFKLTPEDMAAVDGLNCDFRILKAEWFKDHPHHPFALEF